MIGDSNDVTDPTGAQIQIWVRQAKEDLARRSGVAAADIELVGFETRVWPDASLGCPQPGMLYAQVITEGYLIRLRVSGEVFVFRGGEHVPPFLCETTPNDD